MSHSNLFRRWTGSKTYIDPMATPYSPGGYWYPSTYPDYPFRPIDPPVYPAWPPTPATADETKDEIKALKRLFTKPKTSCTPTPNVVKIAIFGKMRSGKDTLAKALLASGVHAELGSFADPLYESMKALYGDAEKRRDYLQRASKELTDADDFHFVRLLAARHPNRDKKGLILTDARRAAEYAWCRAEGFLLVRLEISPEMQVARGAEPSRLDHPTETALDLLDACPDAWDLSFGEDTSVQERVYAIREHLGLGIPTTACCGNSHETCDECPDFGPAPDAYVTGGPAAVLTLEKMRNLYQALKHPSAEALEERRRAVKQTILDVRRLQLLQDKKLITPETARQLYLSGLGYE